MAWYQLATKKLSSIGRVPKNLGDTGTVRDAVKNFVEHIQSRLTVAKKQNDQVYHERIPEPETLESFSGVYVCRCVRMYVHACTCM